MLMKKKMIWSVRCAWEALSEMTSHWHYANPYWNDRIIKQCKWETSSFQHHHGHKHTSALYSQNWDIHTSLIALLFLYDTFTLTSKILAKAHSNQQTYFLEPTRRIFVREFKLVVSTAKDLGEGSSIRDHVPWQC